jgi:hypothetical protein
MLLKRLITPPKQPKSKKQKIITGLWHAGWPMSGGYPGAYPGRYLKYMRRFIEEQGLPYEPVLHLFSGSLQEGVTIDIKAEVNPTHVLDLTKDRIPYDDNTFAVVLADPPYDRGVAYEASKGLYNITQAVPRYSFVPEAVRVLRTGGIFAVLHTMPYRTPKGCKRFAMFGVTLGTTSWIRCASIFQKGV